MLVLIGGDIRPRVIDGLQHLVATIKNTGVGERELAESRVATVFRAVCGWLSGLVAKCLAVAAGHFATKIPSESGARI